ECRRLVAANKGQEIRLLPYRTAAPIITSANTFLSYRDIDTSKADVRPMVSGIKVPILICYDPADNIHGLGSITMRGSIVSEIQKAATSAEKVDVVPVPSKPGNTPVQAHSFVGNEDLVTGLTARWLRQVVK